MHARLSIFIAALLALLGVIAPGSSSADCPFCFSTGSGGGSGPNVRWKAADSLAVCPAGDTLVLAGHSPLHPHASRLRVEVEYFDNFCATRAGVPPDSIWLEYASGGGVIVNDQGPKIFADDTTDACGFTRITVPSLSGCGDLIIFLYISGVPQGSRVITVRSTDVNADGRTTAEDMPPCDINYDGSLGGPDAMIAADHTQHGHRQALHGTLVRRTSLNDGGAYGAKNTIGNGAIFWSPDGRRIVYSARDTCPSCPFPYRKNPCRIKWVWSDEERGNTVHNLTFNSVCPVSPCDTMDYDPSWSPRGGSVYYVRADRHIRRKGVPGLNADTSDALIFGNNIPKQHAQVSPDGDSVAFVQNDVNGRFQVFIVPAAGGPARQLTMDVDAVWYYPHWSPDGSYLTATRQLQVTPFRQSIWKIRMKGIPNPMIYYGPPNVDASHSAVTPDTQVMVATTSDGSSPRTVHLMDGTAAMVLDSKQSVENYPLYTYAGPYPRFSPDGTRLALLAIDPDISGATLPQLWATRRNMNLAPVFTSATSDLEGTRAIADSAAVMFFEIASSGISHISVLAGDPEGDALSYQASFLQPWMTWFGGNRTLAVSPPASANNKDFVVKFWVTSASGGTDSFIAVIHVGVTEPPGAQSLPPTDNEQPTALESAKHEGALAVFAPQAIGEAAQLTVFDVAGRRVATIRGPSGSWLIWDGRDHRTTGHAKPGIYLYRMDVGSHRQNGKVLVLR